MSEEGEKTCPLCAEEMDLTDRQLKPCKCGYEICVWCWHHIMEMAEKDDTEGRCPACRSSYDKEKIVGMAANCERLVAEINSVRKVKSQKMKSKSSEGRKQLSGVRVIQRNLVYIVGLPLNLADEDLLHRREYFGQYGSVLKVSMSRTASGMVQQFPNNTCSVYITYSKEEEAIRCIQSVHGFVLEGRSLKACFGTTKYCHAWLRNVPCTNPDCLYLHEIGSQEDSFTKDEIISAYARSRVQQITGTTNNLQRRSGNILPPPLDDYCHNSSVSTAKPIAKNTPNNTVGVVSKSPPPNGRSSKTFGLPSGASWGMRASSQPQPAAFCSNGPSKEKTDMINGTSPFSFAVTNTNEFSALHNGVVEKSCEESDATPVKGKSDTLKSLKQSFEYQMTGKHTEPDGGAVSSTATKNLSIYHPAPKFMDHENAMRANVTSSSENTRQSCISADEKEGSNASDGKIESLCADVSILGIESNVLNEHSGVGRPSSSFPEHRLIKSPNDLGSQQFYADQYQELIDSAGKEGYMRSSAEMPLSTEQFDRITDQQAQTVVNTSSEIEDVLFFDNQRLKDPEVIRSPYLPNSASSFHLSNHYSSQSLLHSEAFGSVDRAFVDDKASSRLPWRSASNGYPDQLNGQVISNCGAEGKKKQMGVFHGNAGGNISKDMGESSIISNMDFDSWPESLTSPQNLATLLGETEKQPMPLKPSSPWKIQNSNQSRFSFAWQEDNQSFGAEPSFVFTNQTENHIFSQDIAADGNPFLDKLGLSNTGYLSNSEGSDKFNSGPSNFPSNKATVSRAQISAPPGFSIPSRTPPPGFSSHDRAEQSFGITPGNHLFDSLMNYSYQTPSNGSIGSSGDIEFMDPAILAVGKGRLQVRGGLNNLDMGSNLAPQLNAFENESRLHQLIQRSLSPHQNLRYAGIGDNLAAVDNSFGMSSRLVDETQVNSSPFVQLSFQRSRNSHMPNGDWDGWNEVHDGNGLGVAEMLRNENIGFNKFYTGFEDSKFRMPSSGGFYNRTFGI